MATNHTPFEIGHRAFLLRPLRGRQHDVGQFRRLRWKEVGDHEKVELLQAIDHVVRIGGRDHRVRAHDKQPANAVGLAGRVEQLVGRLARRRQVGLGNAPGGGDVVSRRRIVNRSIARQLIRFLPVLAATLPVALPRQGAETAERAADLSKRKREIDERKHVVDASRVLLGATGCEHHGGSGASEHARGLDQVALRHARQHLDTLGPVRRRHPLHVVEALRTLADVLGVDLSLSNQQVQQPVGECRIGAGAKTQVKLGPLRRRRSPRVGDHERAAVSLLCLEVPHDRRHRLCRIGADEQDGLRFGNVLERKRQSAIEAERARSRRGRRRHAEPAVVVDVRRAERHARKLSQQVGLLVGQRAAAENTDRVATVVVTDAPERRRDAIERLVPSHGRERVVAVAREWREQAIRMPQRVCGRPALGAQAAFVHRKLVIARHRDRTAGGKHVHAALKRAVRTMSRGAARRIHSTIARARTVPSRDRAICANSRRNSSCGRPSQSTHVHECRKPME